MISSSSGVHIVLPDYYSSDVMSAWSGIRPLATNPDVKGTDTAPISRDHVVCLDLDGLVTVTGGKWTTYRRSVFPRRCRRTGQC